jgi:hypothetical protein
LFSLGTSTKVAPGLNNLAYTIIATIAPKTATTNRPKNLLALIFLYFKLIPLFMWNSLIKFRAFYKAIYYHNNLN